MPMPPLPQNNTARIWIDYTSKGRKHSMMVRAAGTPSSVNASEQATAIANYLKGSMLATDSFLSARMSLAHSAFSLPISFIAVPGSLPGSTVQYQEDPDSTMWSLTGRGAVTARKWRFDFYTAVSHGAPWPDNNRFENGEYPDLDGVRVGLLAILIGESAVLPAVTVEGDVPVVNAYWNIRKNGYWQTKQR